MKKKLIVGLFAVLVALTLTSGRVHADHTNSLFLKGDFGPARLTISADKAVHGNGVGGSVAVGYSFDSGWVLYGELFNITTWGLDSTSITCDSCRLSVGSDFLPGLGVAYYTPGGWNTHLSWHEPRATLVIPEIDASIETARGEAFFLTLGKEWPDGVFPNANMGLALKLGMINVAGLKAFAGFLLVTVSRR